MIPRKSAGDYSPSRALSRIRFYLQVLEQHVGAPAEKHADLLRMEQEADRRDAERVAAGQR